MSKKIINNLLSSINKLVNRLTDEELKKIESGKFELNLSFPDSKNIKSQTSHLDQNQIKAIIVKLDTAVSREEGLLVIESNLKNKSELEIFAKHIDVAIMRSDRVEQIKNNIVDATVGARLRSEAIQGKKI